MRTRSEFPLFTAKKVYNSLSRKVKSTSGVGYQLLTQNKPHLCFLFNLITPTKRVSPI